METKYLGLWLKKGGSEPDRSLLEWLAKLSAGAEACKMLYRSAFRLQDEDGPIAMADRYAISIALTGTTGELIKQIRQSPLSRSDLNDSDLLILWDKYLNWTDAEKPPLVAL